MAKIKFKDPSPYSKALIEEGFRWVDAQASGRYANRSQWGWSFFYLALLVITYSALLLSAKGPLTLLGSVLVGLFSYMVIAAFCHDASHGSLHEAKWVNQIIVYLGFAIIGVCGPLWAHRHIRRHHPFPNVAGSDVDADGSTLIRLAPYTEWNSLHRFQPIYAPFLYAFVLTHVAWIEDFSHWKKARSERPDVFGFWRFLAFFIGSKLIHFLLFFVLPMLFLNPSLSEFILGYLLATSTTSFVFVVINIGSHITDDCTFPVPDAQGMVGSDWVSHQIESSVDWSPESALFVALTGGANAHAAHHVFPQMAHCHNMGLSEIISKHSRAHKKPHHVLTFRRMILSHWRHLIKMSHPNLP